jgi:glutathione S-transferase
MKEIILHHYAGSPFSEKVRLVLGFKRLQWRSVDVPVILPKPDVVALTGGYRRTPFMQIDADVYCDSALMCRVIDRIAPEPPLYPEAMHGLAEIVAQWADSSLFWAAVPFTMQPAAAPFLLPDASPESLRAFAADRAAMNPSMRRAPLADGAALVNAYAGRLEAMLADSRPFLLGALPSIADFSAAQSIWFMRRAPPIARHLEPFGRLLAWYERIAAFGHGRSEPMTSGDAIDRARLARGFAPCEVGPGMGIEAGTPVGVTASDYAHDEVAGTLVGLDGDEIVVERRDERAGPVHVHFPRVGFHVKVIRKEGT